MGDQEAMSENSDRRSFALGAAAMTWGAILLVVLMALVYRNCQNTDGRIMECVKLGQPAADCGKAMNPGRH